MDKQQPKLSRRTVFAGAGTAGALAAVAAVVPKAPAEAVAGATSKADAVKGGYQETQHVLRYYQTTRV
ncbi:formate dehydrogenase [uncultured Piscinibacter sp.]|uniref:formate dehydrogenase n=1 Tax=uncultured Piscinibacter sp. TaxID=1131835 RepID=UPI002638FD66|nr:formate dehydrogenase [uncultured Piscinibacter sp.]